MTDKLFDDFLKQKLEHYDSGSPMHVWEKVRRELHEDNDDKGVVWWKNPVWLLGIFLLSGITTTSIVGLQKGWFRKSNSNVNAAAETISINNNSEKNNHHKIVTPTTTTTGNSINKQPAPALTSDQASEKTVNEVYKPAPGTYTRHNSILYKVEAGRNNASNQLSTGQNKYITNASITKPNSNVIPGEIAGKNNENTHIAEQLSLADAAFKRNFILSNAQLNVKAAPSIKLQISTGCPTIGPPRRNDLYLEIYGAGDNVSRNLMGTAFTPADYINKRNEAEKNRAGFSAGIRIAKNLGERLLVKTGINYSQINETLKYVNEKDIRTVTVITTRTVTSGGQTMTISDTTSVTQMGTTYSTFHNHYRTFDIPLLLSYELGNSRNFGLALSAGAIFNIQSVYSGHILDTSLNPVSINTSSTLGVNAWRKNIGIGLYASVSIYKRLNNAMDLFFEPYTRINLNPVTTNSTLVKQKYTTTGLQLGIRYNLFNKRQRYVE